MYVDLKQNLDAVDSLVCHCTLSVFLSLCCTEQLSVTDQQEAGLFIVESQMPYMACLKLLAFPSCHY